MEFSKYDLFAYQIMEYLISERNYQIVRVMQHKNDIWLINPQAENFPVVRIASSHERMLNVEYLRNVHVVLLDMIHREGRLVVFQTNPQAEPIHNEEIIEVYCEPHKISNPLILMTFQQLPHIVRESNDIGGDIVRIMRTIEEAQQRNYERTMRRWKERIRPKATLIALGIFVTLSFFSLLIRSLCSDQTAALILSGSFYKINILAAHEYWRLFTSVFVSDSLLSLILQGIAFYYIAKSCEPYYQKKHFVAIILISIFTGNLFLLATGTNAVVIGLAPALFGLSGSFLIRTITQRLYRSIVINAQWVRNGILLCLLFVLPYSSALAMLGGFVCGIIMGLLFVKKESLRMLQHHTKIATVLMISCLLYLGIFQNNEMLVDQQSGQEVVRSLRKTPLHFYADYLETCYNEAYK